MKKQNSYGRVLVMDDPKNPVQIGFVEYDSTFKCVYPIMRTSFEELNKNAGKGNQTYHKGSKKLIKNSPKKRVLIDIETGWTSESKTPPVGWYTDLCLETLTIVGNRMPYNPRAVKSNRKNKEGEDDLYGQYLDNLLSMYCLPSH